MDVDGVEVRRFAAFSTEPQGGNPAGVVLDAAGMAAERMQAVAAAVGYSETAFLMGPLSDGGTIPVRYFAPEGEVDFCGHATIAAAAALADAVGPGQYRLDTAVGLVVVDGETTDHGTRGALLSPPIGAEPLEPALLDALLACLGWNEASLDPVLRPAIGTAGNRHPVLVTRTVEQLAPLDYDFDALQALCRQQHWITVQLIAAEGEGRWRARDPFPWGGVVEDPATGAAAAAFAGYLRAHGRAGAGDRFTVTQGVEMGRPSTIDVELTHDRARVSGHVAPIPN